MASQALRAIPEKAEARSETKEEGEGREAKARLDDDEIEATREEMELLRTPLATQAILPDNDDVITRAVDMTGSAVTAATSFL